MEAVTTSMMVLLLIFGLGLSGASYNTCKDTLNSNGYSLTDSQYQSFYEAANDPGNLQYISSHQSEMSENWAIVTSSGESLVDSVSDWYPGYISESSISESFTVDRNYAENNSCVSVPTAAFGITGQYHMPNKVISDGHGGYYTNRIVPWEGSDAYPFMYEVLHYDADGNFDVVATRNLPRLFDPVFGWVHASYDVDYYVTVNDDGSQTVTLTADDVRHRSDDNEMFYDFLVSTHEVIFWTDQISDVVESLDDDDNIILPVNPDGTITLPDGTVVTPNEDGTYTISGTDYVPKPGVLDPAELLKQLLDLQEKLKELDEQLQLEKDKEQDNVLDEAIDEAVDDAINSYDGNLSEFLLNSRITQVFPFCLPFDFVRGVKLFSTSPVAPKFDIDFDIPAFCSYPGTHNVITLDLAPYSKYFVVVRWITTVIFIISLTLVTSKLIKW